MCRSRDRRGFRGAPTLDDAAMPIRVMSWHMCLSCVAPPMSLTLCGAQTPDDAALPIRVMSPPTVKGVGPPLFVGAGGAWNAGVWHLSLIHI